MIGGRSHPTPDVLLPEWELDIVMPWGTLAVSPDATAVYGLRDLPERAAVFQNDAPPSLSVNTDFSPLAVRVATASERGEQLSPTRVYADSTSKYRDTSWVVDAAVPDAGDRRWLHMPQHPERAVTMAALSRAIGRVVAGRWPDLLHDQLIASDNRSLGQIRALGISTVAVCALSDFLSGRPPEATLGGLVFDTALEGVVRWFQTYALRKRDKTRPALRNDANRLGKYVDYTLRTLLRGSTAKPGAS